MRRCTDTVVGHTVADEHTVVGEVERACEWEYTTTLQHPGLDEDLALLLEPAGVPHLDRDRKSTQMVSRLPHLDD